ncbi:Probable mitochondrial adenine nucleotide transporter BTL3 [Linum perenne]
MYGGQDLIFPNLIKLQCSDLSSSSSSSSYLVGGIFLDSDTVFPSFFSLKPSKSDSSHYSGLSRSLRLEADDRRRQQPRRRLGRNGGVAFLSVSLSIKPGDEEDEESVGTFLATELEKGKKNNNAIAERKPGSAAFNTTKHLWAGAVAAMVSRTIIAPLERLKLEYIVCGEKKHLFELTRKIFLTQGVKGFWKGNLVNILRTAPFKAINFYAYDTYRQMLLRWTGNEEATNFERFVAGAAAGVTASLLCLPLDTVSA